MRGGGDRPDLVEHLFALDHLAKHRIAPALPGFGVVVEKVIVLDVDKELRGSRMGVHRARHGDRAEIVSQTVIGLVLDGFPGALLLHVRIEAAALNHKVIDNAVEKGAVVKTLAGVHQKISHRDGRLLGIEFKLDRAIGGVQGDHRVSCVRYRETCKGRPRAVRGAASRAGTLHPIIGSANNRIGSANNRGRDHLSG